MAGFPQAGEKVAVNPPLDDRTFGRPGLSKRRNMVTIEAEPMQNAARRPIGPTSPPAAPTPDPGSASK